MESKLRKCQKKTEKTFFVSHIIAFEDVTIIYLY